MPYYADQGNQPGDFPNAEDYYSRCLSLPMYPSLTGEQQQFVIDKILSFTP
jgi:dTDP-4-amino-4,6-dideoxygalactose transaminase